MSSLMERVEKLEQWRFTVEERLGEKMDLPSDEEVKKEEEVCAPEMVLPSREELESVVWDWVEPGKRANSIVNDLVALVAIKCKPRPEASGFATSGGKPATVEEVEECIYKNNLSVHRGQSTSVANSLLSHFHITKRENTK